MTSPKGLYLHIPFCSGRCHYCHFVSCTELSWRDRYIEALVREIGIYREWMGGLETVYIGGGTPSVLEIDQLERVVETLTPLSVREFTLEVNPESLTREKLAAYRRFGVNRLSMGVQTTDDELLATIGRRHTFTQVEQAVTWIRESGFDNLNLDLIYGLPGQSLAQVGRDTDKVLALEPEHLSTYSLTIDEGTLFEKRGIEPVDDGLDRDMFRAIAERAEKAGLMRYEISNFARPGKASRHNLIYWHAQEYLGIGAGAHGYLNAERYANADSVADYLERIESGASPIVYRERIDEKEAAFEYLMLNLRTTDGVDRAAFMDRFGYDPAIRHQAAIQKFVTHGAVRLTGQSIILTPYGMDVSNTIFQAFR